MKKWPIVILGIVILAVAGYFIYQKYLFTNKKAAQTAIPKIVELDSKKETTHLSKVADTKGAYWVRSWEILWDNIEHKKGEFNWDKTDEIIKSHQKNNNYLLAMIQPYANWDQDACHGDEYIAKNSKEAGGDLKVGKPCDMDAYQNFLDKLVERYDGDGENDMPELKIPVKYWEIMNEPEMQGSDSGGMGEELKFFVGSPEDYLEILKISYTRIKATDSEAKILHAGMAGMQENFVKFWDPVMAGGAGKYFDIANIHTINTDEKREDLFTTKFKNFLAKYDLSNKPIWITEVQFGDLVGKPKDIQSFDKLLAKSSVLALAMGADKLFYIENWLFWDSEKGADNKLKYDKTALDSSTHKVYLNLVSKINSFDKISALKESSVDNSSDDEGVTSQVGQYKFSNGKKSIYVLWGKADLPKEIIGTISVTDIYGNAREIEASSLTLDDSPVFVEILK